MITAIELYSCMVDYIADVTTVDIVDASLRSPNIDIQSEFWQAFDSVFGAYSEGSMGEIRWAPLSCAAESSCREAR